MYCCENYTMLLNRTKIKLISNSSASNAWCLQINILSVKINQSNWGQLKGNGKIDG